MLSTILPRVRLDHQLVPVRPQYLAKCLPSIVHRLVVQEVQLLQDVHEVDLLVLCEVLLHNLAVLFVELLDLHRFALGVFEGRQVNGAGAEEAVAVWGARDAFGRAEEGEVAEAGHAGVGPGGSVGS